MATKSRKSRFVYRGDERTTEDVVRNSRRSGGAYDSYLAPDVQLLKLKEGDSTLRILPPSWSEADDDKWGKGWHIEVVLHYGVGPDNATYLCLDKMLGKRCPICEARRAATDDERDQLRPQSRFLCWVIDRANEKAGPQVWSMPVTVFRDINIKSIDKKSNKPIPIDHPDKGFDIYLRKEGTGIKTKYSVDEIDRDPTPLADDERDQDRWLAFITDHPLPDVLQYYEADHIEGVLAGRSQRDDDDEEDDGDRGSGSRRRSASSTRKRDDRSDKSGSPARSTRRTRAGGDEERDYIDDEDEDEGSPFGENRDDEDEDDAETRTASRSERGRRRAGGRDDDPDDEDEEDDDVADEEDEEDEDEDEGGSARVGRGSRSTRARRGRGSPPPDDEDEDEDAAVSRAKSKVSDMRSRRRSRR